MARPPSVTARDGITSRGAPTAEMTCRYQGRQTLGEWKSDLVVQLGGAVKRVEQVGDRELQLERFPGSALRPKSSVKMVSLRWP